MTAKSHRKILAAGVVAVAAAVKLMALWIRVPMKIRQKKKTAKTQMMNLWSTPQKTMKTQQVQAQNAAVVAAVLVKAKTQTLMTPIRWSGSVSLVASKMKTSRAQPESKPKSNVDVKAGIKAVAVHRS